MKTITQNCYRHFPLGTIALAFVLFVQISFPARSQSGSSLDQGLILWYPFCGNAKDESGNDRHGEVTGATLTTDRFGKVDRAFKMSIGDSNITTPFVFEDSAVNRSFSMWFKVDKWILGGSGYFLKNAGTANADLLYGVNSALKLWENGSAGLDGPFHNAVFTSSSIAKDEWHHIALTYAGKMSSIKVWINGQPMKHLTEGFNFYGGDRPIKVHDQKVMIPGSGTCVDELRVYNRALSESEIHQLYNKEKAPTSSNCSSEGNTGSPRGHLRTTIPRGLIPARMRFEGPPPSLWRTNYAPRLLTNIILPSSPRGQRIVVRGKVGETTIDSSPSNVTPQFSPTNTSENELILPEGKPTD